MYKKKNKKIKIISIIAVIVIVLAIVFIYALIKDSKQEDILRTEITNLSKKDFSKDRYNMNLVTKGNYATVEKTIKEYMDEYATILQSLSEYVSDNKMATILSADNYKKDGPDFVETKKYLNETKTGFNEKLDKLKAMNNEEEIMKRIEGKNLDQYYVNLYKELMIPKASESIFQKSEENLKQLDEKINNILDTETKVIDLLVSEKGKWNIEEDKIVFQNTDTLNQYNELIKNYQSNN